MHFLNCNLFLIFIKEKNSSFIHKENSTKLLKDIFQKDLSVFSECSGVTYLEFFIVLP